MYIYIYIYIYIGIYIYIYICIHTHIFAHMQCRSPCRTSVHIQDKCTYVCICKRVLVNRSLCDLPRGHRRRRRRAGAAAPWSGTNCMRARLQTFSDISLLLHLLYEMKLLLRKSVAAPLSRTRKIELVLYNWYIQLSTTYTYN